MDSENPLAPLTLPRLLACLALFAASCWLAQCTTHRAPQAKVEAPALEEGPPETWATDGEADAGVIARPMPREPFKGQKKAPCAKDEVTIGGACWMELVRKPEGDMCGSKGFLHDGKCYVPVQQAQRPPTSIMP